MSDDRPSTESENAPHDAQPVEETVVIARGEDGEIEVLELFSTEPETVPDVPAPSAASAVPPLHGVGPLTIRELAIGAVWLVAFFCSFFAVTVGPFASIWSSGVLWILTIGVPTVAVFLLLLRRFSPQGIRRVGSLGIDQFASVAFSVSAVFWFQMVWDTVSFAATSGLWVRTWVMWLELVLMLAGVVLTVFAPFIPVLRDDFRGRPEEPAHPNARPVRAVEPRPARPHVPAHHGPADYAPVSAAGHANAGDTGVTAPYARSGYTAENEEAEPEPVAESARYEAFWALAPVERDVVDEYGAPLFRIGPSAWALVVEDRGAVYVVRHEDGRLGYLHDVSDVVRG